MTTISDVRSNSDAIGILFGQQELDGCRATQTMFGSVRYRRASARIVDGDLDAALLSLLNQLGVNSSVTLPIVAAIPTAECYFATRPVNAGGAKASPRVLLRESLRSSATRLDQMVIDVINWQPDRRAVAGIVAAPTARIDLIREAIGRTKHSLQRLEPAASCLVAVAPDVEGRERRSSLTTRVFLGNHRMLAVMSRGNKPIHWQVFPLPAGDEATGIVSAIRSLETAAGACGLDRTPDAVVIHGRPELRTLIDQQWLTKNVQNDFRWLESPALHGSEIAQAAVERFLAADDDGFDLVRQHREPLQLRRVVPVPGNRSLPDRGVSAGYRLVDASPEMQYQYTSMIASAPAMLADNQDPKPNETV